MTAPAPEAVAAEPRGQNVQPSEPYTAVGTQPPVVVAAPPATAGSLEPEPDPLDLPRDTTPTWEIELLISGATTFTLFQLPGELHAMGERWLPHVTVLGLFGVIIVNIIVVAAIYGLAACFVLHLALRGYWVALVGVNSVYPGGVRWDRMTKYGPTTASLLRETLRPLPSYIARVDNVASLVFATGFVFAASTLVSVVAMGVVALLAWGVDRIGGPDAVVWGMAAVGLPLFLVMATAAALDYRHRDRPLAPGSPAARFVRAVMGRMQRGTPAGVRALSAVMSSNVSPRVVTAVWVVSITAAMGGAMLTADDVAVPGAGNYDYLDTATPGAMDAARYANLRGTAPIDGSVPWLDADVVAGPYVRLYVPYRPMRANPVFAQRCPGITPLASADLNTPGGQAAADRVLRCAERLHAVTLDGRPAAAQFRFFSDPRVNRRGFVAYIPVSQLAAGEHRLGVTPLPPVGTGNARAPWVLPFWK